MFMKYSEDTLKKRIEYYYNIVNTIIDSDINLDQVSIINQIKDSLKDLTDCDLFLLKNYISEIKSPWSIKGVTDPIKIATKNNYLIDIIESISEDRLEAIRRKE